MIHVSKEENKKKQFLKIFQAKIKEFQKLFGFKELSKNKKQEKKRERRR